MTDLESIAHRLAKRDIAMQEYCSCSGGWNKKKLKPIIAAAKEAIEEYKKMTEGGGAD